jgi:hypothetical protein
MFRRRKVFIGLVLLVLGGAVAFVVFQPSRVIRGRLLGEPFFAERPISYWRKELAEDGDDGYLRQRIVEHVQGDAAAAVPILRTLLRDPAANVRWPAASLLGSCGAAAAPAVPDLIAAMDDPEVPVRNHATIALGGCRPVGGAGPPGSVGPTPTGR